jgi:hypothetical protein
VSGNHLTIAPAEFQAASEKTTACLREHGRMKPLFSRKIWYGKMDQNELLGGE